MRPVEFEGQNTIIAKDQRPYLPLPAFRGEPPHVPVTSCWKLTPRERLQVLLTGRIWSTLWTFGNLLQPQRLHTRWPD